MRRGAVGEGDVSTMSMIGQAMIGQGEVEYHGEIIPAIDAMRAEGIEPAILGPKDGLSIVSSNAQGESMVVLLVKEVEELIKLSDAIYCLHLEGLNGGLQPLGERVNEVRGLPGRSIVPQSAAASSRAAISSIPTPSARCRTPSPSAAARPSTAPSTILLSTSRRSSNSRSTARTTTPASSTRRAPHPSARTLRSRPSLSASTCWPRRCATCPTPLRTASTRSSTPGFTGLNRFLTPHEVKTIAFSTIQKTFAALDAENRWLANTTTLDITSFANGIEDHASNLPLAGMRSLRIVDNLRYMLGMELMHAAQAVEMRRDQRADNLLKLGKVTGPLKDAYRKTIPYYDADRNLSIDIEKSYQVIKDGSLLKVIEEAERA